MSRCCLAAATVLEARRMIERLLSRDGLRPRRAVISVTARPTDRKMSLLNADAAIRSETDWTILKRTHNI